MNKIILLGNLTKDIELKTLQSGNVVGNTSIATNESYTNKQGEKVNKVSFHNLTVWGKQAEVLAQYTQKGSKLLVEGKIDYQEYEKDNVKRTIAKIIVDRFEFAGSSKPQGQNNQPAGQSNYSQPAQNNAPQNNNQETFPEDDTSDISVGDLPF